MFLALKDFNEAAIYLSLASVPGHTSLPCVPEDAGLPKFQLHVIPEVGRAGGGEGISTWAGARTSRSLQAPGRNCAEVGDPWAPSSPRLPCLRQQGSGKAGPLVG